MDIQEVRSKLEKYDQMQLLKYYDELDDSQKEALCEEIMNTDFDVLANISTRNDFNRGVISPINSLELDEINNRRDEFEKIGLEAIKKGEVLAVLLAGGMGTRLGADGPKGVYDIGITKHVYIFERLIENLMQVVKKAGVFVPLYIMTSDKNHEETVSFFKEHDFFGYNPEYIEFFKQKMAPASDYEGHIYLEGKGKLSTSPNGNAGWYASMIDCGLDKKAKAAGAKWVNIFAVDNVLQQIADPVFIGAVIEGDFVSGAKVVRKAAKDEKVGVMCLEDGNPSIVEYYDMTEELMDAVNEKGDPAYNFGVILNYLFSIEELDEIINNKIELHVVEKKIPYLDEDGNFVKPEKPNGYKFEQLVLDMVHQMKNCLPFEVVREREFAPIKNKEGVDSVESARKLCKLNGIEL